MNFLAHLYLCDGTPDAMLGSLMGDFVKGPLAGRYAGPVGEAITLHRSVDSFTDAHAIVRASRGRISPPYRRASGILVDMFYDHFLARLWNEYSSEALGDFAARTYAMVRARQADMPAPMARVMLAMAEHDWLGAYRDVAAVQHAIERMSARLARPQILRGGGQELDAHYDLLEADFRAFFPQLARHASTLSSGRTPAGSGH
ncbi:MAG: DUF479 domain-containing protein [Rhodocyclaceae bacterium]|nr:DUF479 domain-containing protein [Rhodocyclaceae bacterium]MBX3668852.1 DUF479 domain-containing protein [Rhodocyclaceae bacterium]